LADGSVDGFVEDSVEGSVVGCGACLGAPHAEHAMNNNNMAILGVKMCTVFIEKEFIYINLA
jgi:hypothetical protein